MATVQLNYRNIPNIKLYLKGYTKIGRQKLTRLKKKKDKTTLEKEVIQKEKSAAYLLKVKKAREKAYIKREIKDAFPFDETHFTKYKEILKSNELLI